MVHYEAHRQSIQKYIVQNHGRGCEKIGDVPFQQFGNSVIAIVGQNDWNFGCILDNALLVEC